jgi:2-oxoglutarate ferredoxin oxidoreductase subunit beta
MANKKDLKTDANVTWCPGCTNFAIMTALQKILLELEEEQVLKLSNVVLVSGIGCHAKIVDYVKVNSFHSIHGRVPPTISGIKLANPELTVIGHAGDGDAYGEGLSHLIFAAKRNINVNFLVHNNRVYALTTGQFTPTSPFGFAGPSTPRGSL